MIKKFNRALVLAPHPDDGELGCGGTMHKLTQSGCEVYYAAFSACRQSVPAEFPADILMSEVKPATKQLGVKPEHLITYDYDVRMFNEKRQDILDDLLALKKQISPDVVFMPSLNDLHQDHTTITSEGVRAFKDSTILCYELLWNNFHFNTSCFISLELENVNAKIEAVHQYKSQMHKSYINQEFLQGLAKARGVQSGNNYAEAFEILFLHL